MDDTTRAPIEPEQQQAQASSTPPTTMLSSKEPLYDPDSYYFVQPNVSGFFQTEQPTWSWPPLPTPAPSPIDATRAPHSISTIKPNENATTAPTNGSNNTSKNTTNTTISDDMLAIYQPIPSSAVIRSVGTVLLLSMVAIYLLLILLARRRRRRLNVHAEQRRRKRKRHRLPESPNHIPASLTQATDASSPDVSEKRGNDGATANDSDSVWPADFQETDSTKSGVSGVSPARLDFAVPDGN
ncbi:hypothetical protein MPSEU_000856100 [Mayamaea pseudoterrestris]|nr:hypothetical protein MPSEU_000856100 [Mayamaea pseudoterrestris]